MTDQTITVTQVKSGAHGKPKTHGTLRALGLGRIGKTNTLPDRPEIRGMIARDSRSPPSDVSPWLPW